MSVAVLDCIVFGLQRFGGISTYWDKVAQHAASDLDGAALVAPRQVRFESVALAEAKTILRDRRPNRVARYLASPLPAGAEVFHSSYYRLPARRVRRHVTTVHDFTYERYRSGPALWVHHNQKRRSIEAADVVICVSGATREDLLEAFPRVDASKVMVIPLAVDRTMFYPSVRSSAEHPPFALFVGQRGGYKRFDLAVRAVAQAGDGLHLGIVGPALSEQERLLLSGALGDRWIQFGSVEQPKLRELYQSAELLLFPSDYEGFGLPILEAMACGCPVVAANRSSFPEVAGGAALLADAQSPEAYAALLRKARASDVRARLVADGLEQASRFSWTLTLARTMALYV